MLIIKMNVHRYLVSDWDIIFSGSKIRIGAIFTLSTNLYRYEKKNP